LQYVLVSKE